MDGQADTHWNSVRGTHWDWKSITSKHWDHDWHGETDYHSDNNTL